MAFPTQGEATSMLGPFECAAVVDGVQEICVEGFVVVKWLRQGFVRSEVVVERLPLLR